MKFGMPTLLELNDLKANVDLALKLGLSFVEINANVPEFQVDSMDPEELLNLSHTTGIGFTLHLDEYLSITDPNQKISNAYIQSVLESVAFAKKTHISRLTMHMIPGVVFTLPTQKIYVYEKYNAYYLDRLTQFRDQVTQAIGLTDIIICIENTEGFKPYMRQGIELLLESPVFGLTYDCGHNARYDQVDEDFMKAHQSSIYHMHLHDVLGKKDHQPCGTGDLDLKAELAFASLNDPSVVVEVKSVESLTQAVIGLNHMLESKKS